jgi:hypothetical protein
MVTPMSIDFVLDFSLNHNHAQNCECLFNKNCSLCTLTVFDDGIGVGKLSTIGSLVIRDPFT